jgi:hypothetical protein
MWWRALYLLADIGPMPMTNHCGQEKLFLMYGPSNLPMTISMFSSAYQLEWAS